MSSYWADKCMCIRSYTHTVQVPRKEIISKKQGIHTYISVYTYHFIIMNVQI